MGDVLLVLGFLALAAAGFWVALPLGLVIAGLELMLLGLAFSDGKGFKWRS